MDVKDHWTNHLNDHENHQVDTIELEIITLKERIRELRAQYRKIFFRGTGRMKR